MNDKNFDYYNERLKQHKIWGCRLPEAAALHDLIQKLIIDKDYYDIKTTTKKLDYFDVIVIFPLKDIDYLFGIYDTYDNNSIIKYSTNEGIKFRYL